MQKFGEVKFSTDRVKIQIWGIPVIFSHELCLYITRFVQTARDKPLYGTVARPLLDFPKGVWARD